MILLTRFIYSTSKSNQPPPCNHLKEQINPSNNMVEKDNTSNKLLIRVIKIISLYFMKTVGQSNGSLAILSTHTYTYMLNFF